MSRQHQTTAARRPSGEGETLVALEAEIERERCRLILTDPHAELRGRLARHLAFETELCAAEAVAILRGAPIDPRTADEEDVR